MGEMVTFPANGKVCSGYRARGGKDGPGVVVIQEWWGVNAHVKSVVDRFAAAGYTALAPDLYHGVVAEEPDEAKKRMMALSIDDASRTIRGAIEDLRGETGRKVGIVGFCMGGALSLYAACENPNDIAACVDFYGVHPAITYNFARLSAPVLGLFAEKDHGVTPDVVKGLDSEMTAAGKEHQFILYPGADHAFFNSDRPEVYDAEAATDAWEKVLTFYKSTLE